MLNPLCSAPLWSKHMYVVWNVVTQEKESIFTSNYCPPPHRNMQRHWNPLSQWGTVFYNTHTALSIHTCKTDLSSRVHKGPLNSPLVDKSKSKQSWEGRFADVLLVLIHSDAVWTESSCSRGATQGKLVFCHSGGRGGGGGDTGKVCAHTESNTPLKLYNFVRLLTAKGQSHVCVLH